MGVVAITEVLFLLDMVPLTAGAAVGWMRFRQLGPAFRYLTLYLSVVAVVETLAKIHLYVWTDVNNLYLLHIYTPLEFLLLSLMYRKLLHLDARQYRNFTLYIAVMTTGIVSYSVYELCLSSANDPRGFQLYSKAFTHGSIITCASLFVIQALRRPGLFLEKDPFVLYLNSAVLLYFSGSFIIFLAINYLMRNAISDTIYFWLINVILTFVLHLVCLWGLWRNNYR